MSKTTAWLAALAGQLEMRSPRERLLLLASLLAVVAALWYSFLAGPLWAERRRVQRDIADILEQNRQIQGQSSDIMARHQGDPDAGNRRRRDQLRAEIQQADARLQQMTLGLIPPKEMAQVLEQVLRSQPGLRLVKLENLEPQVLGVAAGKPPEPGQEAGVELPHAYRHGLRLEFEGTYLAALAYLHQLESLPYGFIWEELALEVLRYPKARIVIAVYTLSLQKGWIGV